ncbi:M48 family metallopeptidase [uncultured Methanolobus sp.]|uniref:M48 family metallopeptidase n=1 Tax=uncultured Methanolobus sp. TaxID=218300 RepID=UPI0029C63902|nr:M48 family metallopeptidase [uncultured Methanolobus sp.]
MHLQASIRDMVIDYELIRRDVKNPRLEFRDQRLYLIVPHSHKDHEKIIQRHKRWIYNRYSRVQKLKEISQDVELVAGRSVEELKELVNSFIAMIGDELGAKPQRIGFRKMKTKWGSCSSRGNLNFNSHMRHLPDRIIEYIVFHEMVHLIELNHSHRFWNHIKERFPDYKEYETMLAAYWSLIQKQCIGQSL